MKRKNEQILRTCILIIGAAILSLCGIFLAERVSNFPKTTTISRISNLQGAPEAKPEGFQIQKPSTSSDEEFDDKEIELSDKISEMNENFEVSEDVSYTGPEGQLVRYLFSINQVPSPKGAAFSPDGKEIWVTLLLNKKRGVSVFDSSTGKKIQDINLDNGGGVEIIFSHDGSKAYVSQMETAKVFEIDAGSKKVLRTFNTESAWTKVLELSPDGKTLFASNWSGDDVSEIDLEQGKLRRRIATVDTPRGLYITENSSALYVAGFAKGEIEKIDLKTGIGKVIFKNGVSMRHIVADEEKGLLYVSDMGRGIIWKLSLEDDKVEKFADTDYNPNTIVLSPDKKILFVSCRGINDASGNYYIPGPEWGSVLLFDTETGQMLDAIIGGNQPTALAVSPDGKFLVFSDFLDGRLTVYEIPSYEELKKGNGGISKVYRDYLKK